VLGLKILGRGCIMQKMHYNDRRKLQIKFIFGSAQECTVHC